jgi:site-specific DNA recombinase
VHVGVTVPNFTDWLQVRALILARVSHDSSGVGRSVEEQVAEGIEWAQREQWDVVHIIRETGSASRYSQRRTRPEWDEALDWVQSGRIDVLITWEASRATRDLSGFAQLRDTCAKHGVKWGYGGTVYDLQQRSDRLRAGIDAILAEDEVHRTSERIKRSVRFNAAAGRPHGKNLYGYRRRYNPETKELIAVEIDPLEASVVREAAERIIDGESLYSIAVKFNKRGVSPRRPKRKEHRQREGWTGVAVKQMLTTPGYAGLRTHNGEIVADAMWPAIIPHEMWLRVQAILKDRSRPRYGGFVVANLLSGIAECGTPGCHARLVVGRNSAAYSRNPDVPRGSYRTYTCPRFHTSIAMKYLDAIVVEHAIARISRPDFLLSLRGADGRSDEERLQLLDEIAEHNAWLEKVRERAAAERNLDLLFDQEARIKPLIEAAKRKLDRLTKIAPAVLELSDADDAQEMWDSFSLDTKRLVIRSLMRVKVSKATRPGVRGVGQALERTHIEWLYGEEPRDS